MSTWMIFFTGIGLAMDAFAVSVCQGLKLQKLTVKEAVMIGGTYGFFQALMPTIGYIGGLQFQRYIESFDHWIAFILLGIIGLGMIKEAREEDEDHVTKIDALSFKELLMAGIATSIDALVVGVTLALLDSDIVIAAAIIGITTFCITVPAVYIGHLFGAKFRTKAELIGGIVLILIGLNILIEHL